MHQKEEAFHGANSSSTPIRVLVVDDVKSVRHSISILLESQPGIEVVSEASNGADAIRQAMEHKPDVVLMDLSMPVMNGLDATRCIKRALPSTLILMVSQFDSAPAAKEAIEADAMGYILKDNVGTELIPNLRKIRSSS